MAWSDGVVEQFEIVDLYTTEESDFKFYGPFNSLLSELFPISEHYMVSPQFKRVDGSLDFTVRFIVRRRRVPVFFIEVKTFRSLKELSTRGGADDQIRQRFLLRLRVQLGRQKPRSYIARDPIILNDTVRAYNLLEETGKAKLREVVNEVKGMAAAV